MPVSSASIKIPVATIYLDRDPSLKTLLIQEALKARGLYDGPLDNWWGPNSERAYQVFLAQNAAKGGIHVCMASTFADPADVRRFQACKAQGKTDQECFEVGDNGIGYFGDYNTTTAEPQCALHTEVIREKWGSIQGGKFRRVRVVYKDKSEVCKLTDICGHMERIDLNPGACRSLGFPIGGLEKVIWSWVDEEA